MTEPVSEQTDDEVREFGDELSDEALDRAERVPFCVTGGGGYCA
jgi:hypothetical protein